MHRVREGARTTFVLESGLYGRAQGSHPVKLVTRARNGREHAVCCDVIFSVFVCTYVSVPVCVRVCVCVYVCNVVGIL